MSGYYIKFNLEKSSEQPAKEGLFFKGIKAILTSVLPIANPDFDKKIEEVNQWLIEFENSDSYPNREIGLDDSGKPIMIMPWKKNYGYWTDNNLTLENVKSHFSIIEITQEEFENYWNLFEELN